MAAYDYVACPSILGGDSYDLLLCSDAVYEYFGIGGLYDPEKIRVQVDTEPFEGAEPVHFLSSGRVNIGRWVKENPTGTKAFTELVYNEAVELLEHYGVDQNEIYVRITEA